MEKIRQKSTYAKIIIIPYNDHLKIDTRYSYYTNISDPSKTNHYYYIWSKN